jgi:SAM-dependent methyltransferase
MSREMDARVRWDARWERNRQPQPPAACVVESARFLPATGTALDVAGGSGRNAVWLAGRGLEVTLVDVSPVALTQAQELSVGAGIDISTLERDLEALGWPDGEWDVVLIHHFLARELLAEVASVLLPGGILILCQPTTRNLERHVRPGPSYLVDEGEFATIVAKSGLEPLVLEETWGTDGRHEARVVARRSVG